MDGWMDGWKDGWIDRWMRDEKIKPGITRQLCEFTSQGR